MEEYYDNHNGKCDICGKEEIVDRFNRLCIDHNHETGEFRGLLCMGCNRGLGFFRDNPTYLRNAADYVEIVGV